MKAVVYTRYGSPDVLEIQDIPKPVAGDEEVLLKVHAASLNRSDWEVLTGSPAYARMGGLLRPSNHILGSDMAGTVEAAGSRHSQFKPGDEIFGDFLYSPGGLAEYVAVRTRVAALKPAGLTFEQAAAIPQSGVIALQAIRDKAQLQPGQTVLINGAGGGTGSFAIQLAKRPGAEVTGVDNGEKLEFMRSLGAEHVLDYTRQDFTRRAQQYDFILDLIASRSAFAYARALKPGGNYDAVGGSVITFLQILFFAPWIRRTTGKKLHILVVRSSSQDLLTVADMCLSGELVLPIDRRFPLSEAPAALRYLGEGHAKGKVVITVLPNAQA